MMDEPTLAVLALFFSDPARSSTLILTSLMVIGLVFFIRASTKDRIEVAQFSSPQPAESLEQAVMKYFYTRAYQPDAEAVGQPDKTPGPTIINGKKLVGMVSPSVFMAVFLSAMAAVGLMCLSLISATLSPSWGGWAVGLVALSPLAGVFYWKKSSRPEAVVLKVENIEADANPAQGADMTSSDVAMSKLTVKGHRDELADLEIAFAQPDVKAWAGLERWELE